MYRTHKWYNTDTIAQKWEMKSTVDGRLSWLWALVENLMAEVPFCAM